MVGACLEGELALRRVEAQTCFTTTTAEGGMVEGQSHGMDSSTKPFLLSLLRFVVFGSGFQIQQVSANEALRLY
jgi:hypothetical protein